MGCLSYRRVRRAPIWLMLATSLSQKDTVRERQQDATIAVRAQILGPRRLIRNMNVVSCTTFGVNECIDAEG